MGKRLVINKRNGESEQDAYERALAAFVLSYDHGCDDGKRQFLNHLGIVPVDTSYNVDLILTLRMPTTTRRAGVFNHWVELSQQACLEYDLSYHLTEKNEIDVASLVAIVLRTSNLFNEANLQMSNVRTVPGLA